MSLRNHFDIRLYVVNILISCFEDSLGGSVITSAPHLPEEASSQATRVTSNHACDCKAPTELGLDQ